MAAASSRTGSVTTKTTVVMEPTRLTAHTRPARMMNTRAQTRVVSPSINSAMELMTVRMQIRRMSRLRCARTEMWRVQATRDAVRLQPSVWNHSGCVMVITTAEITVMRIFWNVGIILVLLIASGNIGYLNNGWAPGSLWRGGRVALNKSNYKLNGQKNILGPMYNLHFTDNDTGTQSFINKFSL